MSDVPSVQSATGKARFCEGEFSDIAHFPHTEEPAAGVSLPLFRDVQNSEPPITGNAAK